MPTQDPQALMLALVNQAVASSSLQEALISNQKLRETNDAMAREVAAKDARIKELEALNAGLLCRLGPEPAAAQADLP